VKRYRYCRGGKPALYKPHFDKRDNPQGGKTFTIQCRSEEEAKKILKGLKRKFPEINEEAILKKAKVEEKYIDSKIKCQINIGSSRSFRSICKTAVEFYMLGGGNRDNIIALIPYIKGDEDKDVVWYYYPENDVIKKEKNEVLHSLTVIGDTCQRMLYSYVEFFNAYKFIVFLNNDYNGPDVKYSYTYDILNKKEVAKNIDWFISKDELLELFNKREFSNDKLIVHFSQLLEIIYDRQNAQHISNMTESALNKSLKKYPEGTIITPQMRDEFIRELMNEVAPWITHNFRNG